MLINQNWISVRINDNEACRSSGTLIGFILKFHTSRFKLSLKVAHVCERIKRIAVFVPTTTLCLVDHNQVGADRAPSRSRLHIDILFSSEFDFVK